MKLISTSACPHDCPSTCTLDIEHDNKSIFKINGNKEFADGLDHATIMGLLLWPLFAKDHMHISNTNNGGFKNLLNKIKHTIENMF